MAIIGGKMHIFLAKLIKQNKNTTKLNNKYFKFRGSNPCHIS